jgi:uracil phosphoribosyltransferase
MTASNIHLVGHPLIQHKLTLMRERDRPRAFGNR